MFMVELGAGTMLMYDTSLYILLIYHDTTRHLGLKGKDIAIEIINVGNTSETVHTKGYDVPLDDLHRPRGKLDILIGIVYCGLMLLRL